MVEYINEWELIELETNLFLYMELWMNVTVLLELISVTTAVQFIIAILNLNLYLFKMLHGLLQAAQVTLVGKPLVHLYT